MRLAAIGCVGMALVFLALIGCNRPENEPAKAPIPGLVVTPMSPGVIPDAGQVEVAAQFAAAHKIFTMNCTRCHALGGGAAPMASAPIPGGPPGMMMKGPNLGKVASDARHTRAWLLTYIRDPHVANPMSKMPKFEGKLSEDDLGALADYLASLK